MANENRSAADAHCGLDLLRLSVEIAEGKLLERPVRLALRLDFGLNDRLDARGGSQLLVARLL